MIQLLGCAGTHTHTHTRTRTRTTHACVHRDTHTPHALACTHRHTPSYTRNKRHITRKWFPLQASSLKKMLYFLITNKPILISSMLAAGIAQDRFVGEAVEGEGGKEETTGGYFYWYFTARLESLPFLSS